MPLGIGILEVATLVITTLIVIGVFLSRSGHHRAALVLLGCEILAMILTPADLFSMLVVAAAFAGVYFAGTRQLHLSPTMTAE